MALITKIKPDITCRIRIEVIGIGFNNKPDINTTIKDNNMIILIDFFILFPPNSVRYN